MRLPYKQLNPNVTALLESDELAKKAIESWIEENSTVYFKNSHNSFSSLNGNHYVTMRNVVLWTGDSRSNLYAKLYNHYDLFSDFGLLTFDDGVSPRLYAAEATGLFGYVQITRSLYLFSPSNVVLYLLTSGTEKAESFRQYIEDWGSEKKYSMAKLTVTLFEAPNVTDKLETLSS